MIWYYNFNECMSNHIKPGYLVVRMLEHGPRVVSSPPASQCSAVKFMCCRAVQCSTLRCINARCKAPALQCRDILCRCWPFNPQCAHVAQIHVPVLFLLPFPEQCSEWKSQGVILSKHVMASQRVHLQWVPGS